MVRPFNKKAIIKYGFKYRKNSNDYLLKYNEDGLDKKIWLSVDDDNNQIRLDSQHLIHFGKCSTGNKFEEILKENSIPFNDYFMKEMDAKFDKAINSKSFEKFIHREKKKIEKEERFYNTASFNLIARRIKKYFKLNPESVLQSDDYNDDVAKGITNAYFCKLCSCILEKFKDFQYSDEQMMFTNAVVNWEGMRVMVVHGQGSFYRITLNSGI